MARSTDDKWLKIAAIVVVAFLLLNVVSYIWMPFLPWMEQRDAGEEVIESQMDAQEAISNYEWFRTQYYSIEEQRNKIENREAELDRFYDTYGDDPESWERQTRTRHNRLQQQITASKNELESLVADYNARSSQANNAVFKCNLPYQVDDRFGITGPPGSGTADEPNDTNLDGEQIEASPPPAGECDGLPSRVETN